ncbi:MAG TPA: multifunctional CCA tRNA nucleotidyl transferase/2'3'-cyclic phosphodiesterase/2'nucleotidase/phosphatase [Steroidobacteraceae bacterium]
MQVYLVGGAVRDELLGRPVTERDWVVVGATPADLERQGYRLVGREFPVFLHPQSNEEYALARLERKTGAGYRGFATEFSPGVSLEQDLMRRDLTINAMARADDGTLIDPYGGRADLEHRLLRHVSPAFAEDPVRVLRVARFAARFAGLGFTVAPATRALMQGMVRDGEVAALVPERVWREMERALAEPTPEAFFDTLKDCEALPVVLPELRWNDADRAALHSAIRQSPDVGVRFAALLAATAVPQIQALCERLHVPNPHRELALLAARLGDGLDGVPGLQAPALLELLESADAFRRPERFAKLLLARGSRGGTLPARALLADAAAAAGEVTLAPDRMRSLHGPEIAAALRAARIERLERLQSERRRS